MNFQKYEVIDFGRTNGFVGQRGNSPFRVTAKPEYSSMTFSRSDYMKGEEMWNDISALLRILMRGGNIATIEDDMCTVEIKWNHNDSIDDYWGVDNPVWITADEHDLIISSRNDREESIDEMLCSNLTLTLNKEGCNDYYEEGCNDYCPEFCDEYYYNCDECRIHRDPTQELGEVKTNTGVTDRIERLEKSIAELLDEKAHSEKPVSKTHETVYDFTTFGVDF